MNVLPPFPIDDASLDLLHASCGIDSGAERTSLLDTLEMFSQLGGSDSDAVEEELDDNVRVLRDQFYSTSDAIVALIEEIRRLRRALPLQQQERT